ncbi:MAG: alpha/beta hydrolase [Planctomycetota bacterium]
MVPFALVLAAQEPPPVPEAPVASPVATADRIEADVAYANAHPAQQLDLYLPARTSEPFAAVLFVHGGGWHSGSRKNLAGVAENLQAHGFACALVGHRLCPPHAWPSMIEDVAAAFAWVHAHIAERGGDAQRLAVCGHSSGAQLVLLLASDPQWLQKHELKCSTIRGVLGLSTPVDLRPNGARSFGGTLMAGKGAEVFRRDAEVMVAASPLTWLTKDLPPVLLVGGEADFPMLLDDARAFAAAAKELGRTVQVRVAAKAAHGREPAVLLAGDDALQPELLSFLADPVAFERADKEQASKQQGGDGREGKEGKR